MSGRLPARRDAQAGFDSPTRYLLERGDDPAAVIDPRRYGQPPPFEGAPGKPGSGGAAAGGKLQLCAAAWLRRRPRRQTSVLRRLSPTGLHPIEIDRSDP